MKRLLIVSFSPLVRDPRVLRQIQLFADNGYEVTTLGYEGKPAGSSEHIEVRKTHPRDFSLVEKVRRLVKTFVGTPMTRYRLYPGYNEAMDWIAQQQGKFDVAFANDLFAIPVALASGAPVHADLHEFSLGQNKHWRWRLTTKRLAKWAGGLLVRAGSVSTVAPGIAARYLEEFGVDPFVVTNSPRFRPEFSPLPTGDPIKLIYMGIASPLRSLDMPMKAVMAANKVRPGSFTLDYYLVAGDAPYIEELRSFAGDPAVTGMKVLDPVPFEEIVPTLRSYDVSFAFFPPTTVNLRHTLPNKFFESVQARLGVITGPSSEMGPYIHEFGFGATTGDWTQPSLDELIASLTPAVVNEWKMAADGAAEALGAESQDAKWLAAIRKLADSPEDPR